MPINPDLTRQDLVDALKTLRTSYTSEHGLLDTTLDNTHHAFVMREWGENKQLEECLTQLDTLIHQYDTVEITITFDYNHPTITPSVPLTIVDAAGKTITMPAKPTELTPEEGKKFYGWNTKADGSGVGYKVGASYIVPTINTTLYAYWGPDPNYVAPEA